MGMKLTDGWLATTSAPRAAMQNSSAALAANSPGPAVSARRLPDTHGAPSSATPPPFSVVADIAIIDSDDDLRRRLGDLFQSIGLHALPFAGPEGLLERGVVPTVRCVLMEVRMRGLSGLDFQSRLAALDIHTPVVFMTAHGDIPMTVRAMKAGAIDFLTKPLREQDLLDAVAVALQQDRIRRVAMEREATVRDRLATLTAREGQVLALVTAGLMNKQIAARLCLSEVTVKMHRSSLMQKMGVRTVAELTRMAAVLERQSVPGFHPGHPTKPTAPTRAPRRAIAQFQGAGEAFILPTDGC